uniref:Uncharacterized protein n=1 Tax=Amphimedon queenslandica TaxID=400682 RepID=A0A1X7TYK1_AMPQE
MKHCNFKTALSGLIINPLHPFMQLVLTVFHRAIVVRHLWLRSNVLAYTVVRRVWLRSNVPAYTVRHTSPTSEKALRKKGIFWLEDQKEL